MYYNLKESELRHLERIEESFLRKVLNTTKAYHSTLLGDWPDSSTVRDTENALTVSQVYS